MKKLFGHKPKASKAAGSKDFAEDTAKTAIPTPLYQKLATHGSHGQATAGQLTPTQPSPEESWDSDPIHLPNPHPQPPPPPPPAIHTPSRTSSFNSLPPGASAPISSPVPPPRSTSPASTQISHPNKLVRHHDREREAYANAPRKKPQTTAPVALGILRALEPPRSDGVLASTRSQSEEWERRSVSESGHGHQSVRGGEVSEKKEKRGFWGGRDKEKEKEKEKERERELQMQQQQRERDRERERERYQEQNRERGREVRREDEVQAELTRMIGYLTATASEDWALVLEVCERASANESSAKEAVRALRREFKYGEPAAQLSAARLWAIMLRNSSDMFISQSTSRKFLDTLEDLLSSSRTSPVVRERLLEVVAAAAYASGSKKDSRQDREGFKGLWKRVKPFDKPEEGIPFDTDDAMFQPPASGRVSGFDVPTMQFQEASPLPVDSAPPTPTPTNIIKKRKSPTRNRIIPPDEDMRRLFQECKIGQGNAGVLSDALVRAKPEDLKKKDVIKEFYSKCRASQELIYAQIPWATSIAERSRMNRAQETHHRTRTISNDINLVVKEVPDSPIEPTLEEKLLAALLGANAELLEALTQWEDLNRIAIERKMEDRSRKEVRMNRRQQQEYEGRLSADGHPIGGSSRTPSPSSRSHSPLPQNHNLNPSHPHPRPHHLQLSDSDIDPNTPGHNLALPHREAPHGPRSPVPISLHSRTPSPPTPKLEPYMNGLDIHDREQGGMGSSTNGYNDYHDEEDDGPQYKPSAKALGKRKVVDADAASDPPFNPDDIYYNDGHAFGAIDIPEPDADDADGQLRHPPVNFVYDAVAERTRQRMMEVGGHEQSMNGVH